MDHRIIDKRIKRKQNNKLKKQKRITFILMTLIVGILSFTLVQLLLATPIKVAGNSMNPSLVDGQRVLFSKLKLNLEDIERKDVVYFKLDDNRFYIKRILGLPGELIEIKEGSLYINGQLYNNSSQVFLKTYGQERWYLKDDQYFVLGDNWASDDSKDSRLFGPIMYENIKGKSLFKIGN